MSCTMERALSNWEDKLRVNVSQEERRMSMFGAGALVAAGLLRGSPIFLILGVGLAFRGATGYCALYQAAGVNSNNPDGKLEHEPQPHSTF
jgi:uncharacterized membrane protein